MLSLCETACKSILTLADDAQRFTSAGAKCRVCTSNLFVKLTKIPSFARKLILITSLITKYQAHKSAKLIKIAAVA